MSNYINNFYLSLKSHPAFREDGAMFIAYTASYAKLVEDLSAYVTNQSPNLVIKCLGLENNNSADILAQIDDCTNFILFYDSDYTQPLATPTFIKPLLTTIKSLWRKSCVFKNFGKYFGDAFKINPYEQNKINENVIAYSKSASSLTFTDNYGSNLQVDIAGVKWTSISGLGNSDLIPGEIATIGSVNGTVNFTGAFLSTIPLAYLYGVITEPMTLHIKDSQVAKVETGNIKLYNHFKQYLDFNPSNSRVEEVGIGTNPYAKIYGINAGFEERHVGLHLGLGGGLANSDHLDLIFSGGTLAFDGNVFIKGSELIL